MRRGSGIQTTQQQNNISGALQKEAKTLKTHWRV
jgi:hypothetical protein